MTPPFPPQGLSRVRDSPASTVLWRRYDFLSSIPPHFVAFAWRYHGGVLICSIRRGTPRVDGQGFQSGCPCPLHCVEKTGSPTFLENPNCALALLYDPGRTDDTRPLRRIGMAPALSTAKAPTNGLSRLNHTASALAVYASQCRLPIHHARLASGRWPGATGRAWIPAGFHRKVSKYAGHNMAYPPFPSFRGARTVTYPK